MCGIAGALNVGKAEEAVRRMVERMRHRGPDDSGVHAPGPAVALGSTRLSIIDLSPAGHQPMPNEDGRIWLVFNGEVYNFHQVRADLERRGHRFRSRTDTEVVLHAYEEWGADGLRRLRGMFAFAVYDARAAGPDGAGATVFLARDPLGIKPLYYSAMEGTLVFASEVRALLAGCLVPRVLSPQGLGAYLLWGSVAEPLTLVEGVRSLPPGHWLRARVGAAGLEVSVEAYWRLPGGDDGSRDAAGVGAWSRRAPGGGPDRPVARAEAVARVRSVLEDSVRAHLVADVPVGVFLSSGVDSTAIAALAARARAGVDTVTVVFPEDTAYSEAALARQTAHHLGTRHHEVALTGSELLRRMDEAVAVLDQPSMDGVNTYFVSWGARQAELKVALSGLGGDELFGGYRTFTWVPRLEAIANVARLVPAAFRAPSRFVDRMAFVLGDVAGKLGEMLASPDGLASAYLASRALFSPLRVRRLLIDEMASGLAGPWKDRFDEAVDGARRLGPFGRVSALELSTYMVNTLLRDTDAMSMAHSLEVRVPFVDRVVVEAVFRVPEPWRNGRSPSGAQKALLTEALADLLPREVAAQPKRTFTLPWERWLRGPLRQRVEEGMAALPNPLRPFLDPTEIRTVWENFLAGRTGWARPWALYVLNAWVRRHLAV